MFGTNIIGKAGVHRPPGQRGKRIILQILPPEVLAHSIQVSEDHHIVKLLFRQMVLVQIGVDKLVMFRGKSRFFSR